MYPGGNTVNSYYYPAYASYATGQTPWRYSYYGNANNAWGTPGYGYDYSAGSNATPVQRPRLDMQRLKQHLAQNPGLANLDQPASEETPTAPATEKSWFRRNKWRLIGGTILTAGAIAATAFWKWGTVANKTQGLVSYVQSMFKSRAIRQETVTDATNAAVKSLREELNPLLTQLNNPEGQKALITQTVQTVMAKLQPELAKLTDPAVHQRLLQQAVQAVDEKGLVQKAAESAVAQLKPVLGELMGDVQQKQLFHNLFETMKIQCPKLFELLNTEAGQTAFCDKLVCAVKTQIIQDPGLVQGTVKTALSGVTQNSRTGKLFAWLLGLNKTPKAS